MIAHNDSEGQQAAAIIIKDNRSNATGIASFIFGLLSIFFLAPLFVPLAVLLGIIALINKQVAWGILGLLCALIGFSTSPILLGLFALTSIVASQSPRVEVQQQFQSLQIPQTQAQQPYAARLEKQIEKETLDAMTACKNKRLSGELKTYAESAKCSNSLIIKAYQHANYPYMDLINLIAAKRLEVSEKIDRKELTEAQAQLEITQFMTHITDTEQQRNARTQ